MSENLEKSVLAVVQSKGSFRFGFGVESLDRSFLVVFILSKQLELATKPWLESHSLSPPVSILSKSLKFA